MSKSINPDLKVRLKTAAILVLSFLIVTAFAKYSSVGAMAFALIVYLLIVVAAFEFSRFPEDQNKLLLLSRFALLIFPASLVLSSEMILGSSISAQSLLAALFGTAVFVQLIGLSLLAMNAAEGSHIEDLLLGLARDQIGFLLLGAGGAATVVLAFSSPDMALLLVAVVAVADSAAYFAGRFYGKKKVAPLVSPKKTVIGTFAGIAIGGFSGMGLLMFFPETEFLPGWIALLVSIVIVLCAQAGDYAKSIIKRRFNVKDFGNIFPGHGGVLDRLDGILGAAPIVLMLVVLVCKP